MDSCAVCLRAKYCHNGGMGADPVWSVERKLKAPVERQLKAGLIEVNSIGSDSGGSAERFVHPQAVGAVVISAG